MKAEFWDKPTAPVDTRVTHNITIPPRHQKVIEVLAERPEGARKGYLNPNFAQTGKLHTSPGLVQFDEKTGLAKIPFNNTPNLDTKEAHWPNYVVHITRCG